MIFRPRSIRMQLTALVVALLVVCCIVLALFVNHSTFVTLDVALPEMPQQDGVLIVFDAADLKQSILSSTLIYLAIIVVVGSIAAYLLIGRYTRPIRLLSSHMRGMGPKSLSRKIEVGGGGEEIEELVRSFNQLTHQLDAAFAMEKRFSASAAHELRTPLAVLQTKLDVFRKKERSREEYDAFLDAVEENTGRLASIVGDLLELTETGELPDKRSVSLPSVLARVCDDLATLASGRQVRVAIRNGSAGTCAMSVLGNADLLYRAFYNLVENAIRYNREGGDVTVGISDHGDGIAVEVADTGEGIDPSLRELVFEPFYRVDRSRSRAFGGAGIGLPLVKTILDRHGAGIEVRDNQPQGTVFTVIFPQG